MIARVWYGFTKPEHAEAYESHLKPELLPGLTRKKGFRGSYVLRRAVGNEIEFITIILWDSLDDVRAIAAHDYEKAVIPEDRLPLLSRYDARAGHYEVASTSEPIATIVVDENRATGGLSGPHMRPQRRLKIEYPQGC